MSTLEDRHADAVVRLFGKPRAAQMTGRVVSSDVTFDAAGVVVSLAIQFRTISGDVLDVNGVSDAVLDAIQNDNAINRMVMVDLVTDKRGVGQLFAAYLWTETTV